jgi:hypothetical protein
MLWYCWLCFGIVGYVLVLLALFWYCWLCCGIVGYVVVLLAMLWYCWLCFGIVGYVVAFPGLTYSRIKGKGEKFDEKFLK